MKVVCVVQARLNSTRLPRKVLLPIAGRPMLWHMLERIKRAKRIDQIVVTCPVNDVMELAVAVPDGIMIDPFIGNENDLVARHLQAAMWAHADIVVRIPSDNAVVDPVYINEAIASYLGRPQVYVSSMFPHVRDRIYLDGVGAEVLSASRLRWLDQATQGQPSYREHPHLLFQDQHLISDWEQYQRHANVRETIRLDVNTQADYEFIKDIYDHFGHNQFTSAEVVAYLDSKKVLNGQI